jgi:F0F1-type ATP synthase membrane subunit b/b'
MNNKITSIISASLVAFVVFTASPAFASSDAGHSPSISDLGVFWVNFLIYVTLLYVLVRKAIAKAWAARRESILASVTSATDEVNAADRELNATEALAKNIAADQEKARGDILRQGQAEADALVSSAKEKSERIKTQAQELLKGEGRSAEASFRAVLVTKAVEISRQRFSQGEFAAKQEQYLDAALSRAKRLV